MKALFVCTGNTCRSLMAQLLFQKAAQEKGLSGWQARSCGTLADPFFDIPAEVPRVLASKGVAPFKHAPSPVSAELLDWADWIFTMTRNHRAALRTRFPGREAKIRLFLEAAGLGAKDLPDPIGQPEAVYARCADEIEKAVSTIIQKHAPSTAKPRS